MGRNLGGRGCDGESQGAHRGGPRCSRPAGSQCSIHDHDARRRKRPAQPGKEDGKAQGRQLTDRPSATLRNGSHVTRNWGPPRSDRVRPGQTGPRRWVGDDLGDTHGESLSVMSCARVCAPPLYRLVHVGVAGLPSKSNSRSGGEEGGWDEMRMDAVGGENSI